MMLEWIAIVLLALLVLFYVWCTVVWRERAEYCKHMAMVERMAAQNLVEAVRRGDGAAAVEGWEKR